MKKALLIVIILTAFVSNSQEKKSYYYNYEGKQISKKAFNNSKFIGNKFTNHVLTFENDSSYINMLHPREVVGKLSGAQLDSLRNYFFVNHNKKISKNEHITINYYTSLDTKKKKTKTSWNIYDKDYPIRLNKRLKPQQQFFICDNYESLINQKQKENYLIDKTSLFKELFFPYYIKYGSFIIIKPDGRFVVIYGEYGKQTVWEVAKNISKTDK